MTVVRFGARSCGCSKTLRPGEPITFHVCAEHQQDGPLYWDDCEASLERFPNLPATGFLATERARLEKRIAKRLAKEAA